MPDCLLGIVERHDCHDRAEDLFLHDWLAAVLASHHGRGIEESRAGRRDTACEDSRTVLASALDEAVHRPAGASRRSGARAANRRRVRARP